MIDRDDHTIRATCRRCGPVNVPLNSYRVFSVRGFENPSPRGAPGGAYAFVCPDCGLRASRRSDGKIITVLLMFGVERQEVDAIPLTSDEADAFERALAAADVVSLLSRVDARRRFNSIRGGHLRVDSVAEREWGM